MLTQPAAMTGNTYKIYRQEIKAMDMFTHLLAWVKCLQWLLRRELRKTDYLFPYIGPNGIPHIGQPMDHNKVQELTNKFTGRAGLKKHYSTHCFRRGGAQYRFMYTPVSQQWSLTMVRWWGGWAVGENVHMHSYSCHHQMLIDMTLTD